MVSSIKWLIEPLLLPLWPSLWPLNLGRRLFRLDLSLPSVIILILILFWTSFISIEIRDPRAFNPAHNYTLGDLSWWLIGLGERSLCWKFFWNGNLRMGVQNQINFQFWFRSLERLKMHRDWVTTWKNKRDKLDIAVVLPGLRAGGRNFSSWKVAVSLENLFLGFMMCAAGCVTWVLLMSRPKFGRKGNHKPDQIMINNWD